MENKKRSIAILGSTGSIGTQALDVIEANPDLFVAEVLTANRNADLLIEQAFFCAISPNQRTLYVATVARILKSGGMLAGLFYNTGQEGGPPFNTTRDDIIKHFSEWFEIRDLVQAKNCVTQRKDEELLAILVRK